MENPIILGKDEKPLQNFATKEAVAVDPGIYSQMKTVIPPLYYWEDVHNGKSVLMTMAFQIHGSTFGMSYPIEDGANFVTIKILRHKLFAVVKESLDALLHHGKKILDSSGNIDPRKVNDEEAIRFRFDERWPQKVAAFNSLVRIKPITRKQAVKLKLLDA